MLISRTVFSPLELRHWTSGLIVGATHQDSVGKRPGGRSPPGGHFGVWGFPFVRKTRVPTSRCGVFHTVPV